MGRPRVSLALAVLCVLLALLAPVSAKWENDEHEGLQEWFRSLPRYNFEFEEVSNEFEPSSTDYWESLLMLGLPFVLLALVSTTMSAAFFSVGWCCVCGCPVSANGYSKLERYTVAITLAALAALAGAGAIGGMIGDTSLHGSINDALDVVEEIATYESTLAVDTLDNIARYDGYLALHVPDSLVTWRDALENATNAGKRIRHDVVDPVEDGRNIFMIITFALVLVACLFGLLSAVLLFGWSALVTTLLLLLCLSVLWLATGANVMAATLVADMCPEIDDVLVEDVFPDSIRSEVQYYMFCNGTATEIWTPLPQEIKLLLAGVRVSIHLMENRTLPYNETLLNRLKSDEEQLTLLDAQVTALSDCVPTSTAYSDTQRLACVNMFNGLATVSFCATVAALISMFASVGGIFAFRRLSYPEVQGEELLPITASIDTDKVGYAAVVNAQ